MTITVAEDGVLMQLRSTRKVHMVETGSVQWAPFSAVAGIATEKVLMNTVIVLASAQAAILGHVPCISPPPHFPPEDVTSDMRYAGWKTRQALELYENFKGYFPTTTAVVICGNHDGSLLNPSHVNTITSKLKEAGLEPIVKTYEPPEKDRFNPGYGTVVVRMVAKRRWPQIFVHDTLI